MSEAFYQDSHVTIFNKDCRNMSELGDNSIHCVVTSPPYWDLRKYEGEQELIWDGDKDCEHQWQMKEGKYLNMVNAGEANRPWQEQASGKLSDSGFCSLCGAWKGAYGLEPTPGCGRPFAKLRDDLTEKELEYVMGELKRCGLG